MAGSTFYGTTNNQYIQPKIVWSSTPNNSGNYSSVTATLYLSRTNSGYTTSGTWRGSITINGTTFSDARSVSITYNSNTFAISYTTTVNHGTNGEKSISISASGGISGTSYSSTSISATVALDKIPRQSTVSSTSGSTIGGNMTVNISRALSSYTHTLWYKLGSQWVKVGDGIATSVTFDLPMALCNACTNVTETLQLCLRTYSGSAQVGEDAYSGVSVSVPESVKPTAAVTVTEAVDGIAAKFGCFVIGKSKINVQITGTPAYSSGIGRYRFTFAGKTYAGANTTVDVTAAGAVIAGVQDHRGRNSDPVTVNVPAAAYSPPTCTLVSADRVNNGEKVKFTYSYSVSPVNNKNTCNVTIQRLNGSTWQTVQTLSGYSATNGTYTSTAAFDTTTGHTFRLCVSDFFGSATSERHIGTAFDLINCNPNGKVFALGKVSENENACEIALNMMISGAQRYTNGNVLYATRSDGTSFKAFTPCNENGNTVIGNGQIGYGDTNIYGKNVALSGDSTVQLWAPNKIVTGTLIEQITGGSGETWAYRMTNGNGIYMFAVTYNHNAKKLSVHNYDQSSGSWINAVGISNDGSVTIPGTCSCKTLSQTSDGRVKRDKQDIAEALETVWHGLHPVAFRFDGDERLHIGYIAQEVMALCDEAGIKWQDYGFINTYTDGEEEERFSLSYEDFDVITASVVQKQSKKIKELESRIERLEKIIEGGVKNGEGN